MCYFPAPKTNQFEIETHANVQYSVNHSEVGYFVTPV